MSLCSTCGQKITPADVPVAVAHRWRFSVTYGTSTPDYTPEELAFMRAVDQWRHRARRIPSCCEMLAILKGLGYAKTTET